MYCNITDWLESQRKQQQQRRRSTSEPEGVSDISCSEQSKKRLGGVPSVLTIITMSVRSPPGQNESFGSLGRRKELALRVGRG
ncbi:hypothetical protein RB195_007139 [Necator americanus]|uniref:Uncharacterized protein n=1 Tax=Necator americanus TaxID=51031 RepID=A0ABR1BZ53_NECAM